MEQTMEIKLELERVIEAGSHVAGFSPSQKKELLANLEATIVLELTTELLTNLTEEGKRMLASEHFENYEELIIFLRKTSSSETFSSAVKRSVASVISEHLSNEGRATI